MFKRKALEKLKYWKEKKAPKYSVLLEGARRVGKTTIAEEFAKQEYRSCFEGNIVITKRYRQ